MLRTLGKSKFIFLSFHNYAAQNYNKYLEYTMFLAKKCSLSLLKRDFVCTKLSFYTSTDCSLYFFAPIFFTLQRYKKTLKSLFFAQKRLF